jgi:hypothetical protein
MIMSEQNGTETRTYRWVSNGSAQPSYRPVHKLLRRDVPEVAITALFTALTLIRGAHRVVIDRSGWSDRDSGWRSVTFTGTDGAQRIASAVLTDQLAELIEADSNADHDHDACIASARAMGVPASYAHTPETYLSA